MLKKTSLCYILLAFCNRSYTMELTSQAIAQSSHTIQEIDSWIHTYQTALMRTTNTLTKMKADSSQWVDNKALQTASQQLVQYFSEIPCYKVLVQNPDDGKSFLTFREVFFKTLLSPIFLNNVKDEAYQEYLQIICLTDITLKDNLHINQESNNSGMTQPSQDSNVKH